MNHLEKMMIRNADLKRKLLHTPTLEDMGMILERTLDIQEDILIFIQEAQTTTQDETNDNN